MEVRLLFVLLGTNLFDVFATQVALAHGVMEANPLVLTLLASTGIAGVALLKLTCIAPLAAVVRYGHAPLWFNTILLIVTGVYCLLTIYHLYHVHPLLFR